MLSFEVNGWEQAALTAIENVSGEKSPQNARWHFLVEEERAEINRLDERMRGEKWLSAKHMAKTAEIHADHHAERVAIVQELAPSSTVDNHVVRYSKGVSHGHNVAAIRTLP